MRYPYLVPLAMLVILLAASCTYRQQADRGVRGAALAPPAHHYTRPVKREPLPPMTDAFAERLIFGPAPENDSGITIKRRQP